jgi:lycopene cyclase domain-containing protein
MTHYTYLLLLVFTISYPLLKSFEEKIFYCKKWKYLFPGILLGAAIFIAWDIWFTNIGIWKFNPDFILGIYILKLPMEEWLFFLIVPFSCVFIYEVSNHFIKKEIPESLVKMITLTLTSLLLVTAGANIEKLYTAVTFIALAGFLLVHLFMIRSNYLGRFYVAWSICAVPFLIVNGFLTAMHVLIYNNPENLNLRIYTIPVEDFFYGMLNILLVVTVYEYLKQKDHEKNHSA